MFKKYYVAYVRIYNETMEFFDFEKKGPEYKLGKVKSRYDCERMISRALTEYAALARMVLSTDVIYSSVRLDNTTCLYRVHDYKTSEVFVDITVKHV